MDENNKKEMYQLADYRYQKGAFPIEWNKLPIHVVSQLSNEGKLCNQLKYTLATGTIDEVTVAFFRKVNKFRKGITSFTEGDIIYGI